MPNEQTNNTDRRQNWAGEITPSAPAGRDWNTPWTGQDTRFPMTGRDSTLTSPQMRNNLPAEVIESPTSLDEAYLGSLKATLVRNKGNFIVATFLIGTQSTVSWEGILYEVGNDYVTIYQPGRDRYVVIDMYSLKYMEFYDTQRRALCDELLAQRGIDGRNAMRAGAGAMAMADNSRMPEDRTGRTNRNIMGGMDTMNTMNGRSGESGGGTTGW